MRYRARYTLGALCLAAATGFSLAIPWTVKHAIDALAREGAGAALGGDVGLILALAAAHGVTRLGSRFATIGAAQRVEADLRDGLYAALQKFPPEFFARHSTGDLMTRASSDVTAVRSLVVRHLLFIFAVTYFFTVFSLFLKRQLGVGPEVSSWLLAGAGAVGGITLVVVVGPLAKRFVTRMFVVD